MQRPVWPSNPHGRTVEIDGIPCETHIGVKLPVELMLAVFARRAQLLAIQTRGARGGRGVTGTAFAGIPENPKANR